MPIKCVSSLNVLWMANRRQAQASRHAFSCMIKMQRMTSPPKKKAALAWSDLKSRHHILTHSNGSTHTNFNRTLVGPSFFIGTGSVPENHHASLKSDDHASWELLCLKQDELFNCANLKII